MSFFKQKADCDFVPYDKCRTGQGWVSKCIYSDKKVWQRMRQQCRAKEEVPQNREEIIHDRKRCGYG